VQKALTELITQSNVNLGMTANGGVSKQRVSLWARGLNDTGGY